MVWLPDMEAERLPSVCARCGAPSTGRVPFSVHIPARELPPQPVIRFSSNNAVMDNYVETVHSVPASLPACSRHLELRHRRVRRDALVIAVPVAIIVLLIGFGTSIPNDMPWQVAAGVLGFGSFAFLLIALPVLIVQERRGMIRSAVAGWVQWDQTWVELDGVHPAFAEATAELYRGAQRVGGVPHGPAAPERRFNEQGRPVVPGATPVAAAPPPVDPPIPFNERRSADARFDEWGRPLQRPSSAPEPPS